MSDKRVLVEITCVEAAEISGILSFIQEAIERARATTNPLTYKYEPRILAQCACLMDVVGGRLLGPDESYLVTSTTNIKIHSGGEEEKGLPTVQARGAKT